MRCLIFLFVFCSSFSYASIKPIEINKSDAPAFINFKQVQYKIGIAQNLDGLQKKLIECSDLLTSQIKLMPELTVLRLYCVWEKDVIGRQFIIEGQVIFID